MKPQLQGLGLMSGTSLDGLDIAWCRFNINKKISYEILAAKTISYSEEWRSRLGNAQLLSAYDLTLLHRDFGVFCADYANQFCREYDVQPDFIASHGHTVFHQPEKGISTQIGSGASIAALTGFTTVCDFRSLDVELGGQGAPLVPIGDEYLFADYDACLNIGGIANISFKKNGRRIAYDICAANIVLNELSKSLGLLFDKDGDIAKNGVVNKALLDLLDSNEFYAIDEKKSIGREWVEKHVLEILNHSRETTENKLRTFTEHIAIQIAEVLKKNNLKRMLVTGGGTYNRFLIDRLGDLSGAEIILPSKTIIEYKEALIFAFLGALRLLEKENTLSDVTGAKYNSCGGAVYLGKAFT